MYERARRISTGRVIKRTSKFTGCTSFEIKTERVQGLISALGVRPKTRNSGARFFRDTLYADYFVKLVVPWRDGFVIPCRNTPPNSVTSNNPRRGSTSLTDNAVDGVATETRFSCSTCLTFHHPVPTSSQILRFLPRLPSREFALKSWKVLCFIGEGSRFTRERSLALSDNISVTLATSVLFQIV